MDMTELYRGYSIEWRPEVRAYEVMHGTAHVGFEPAPERARALIDELQEDGPWLPSRSN